MSIPTSIPTRVVLRCLRCRLVQYETSTNRCRACGRQLKESPPSPATTQPPAALQRRGHGAAAIRSTVATAVREWRIARDLTQKRLGARIKLHRTNISRVEDMVLTPMPQQVERLAAGLRVPLSVLLASAIERRYLIELVSAGAGRLTGAQRRQVLDQVSACRNG